MKKTHFLRWTLVAIMIISAVATVYPMETLAVGIVLMPACLVCMFCTSDEGWHKRKGY